MIKEAYCCWKHRCSTAKMKVTTADVWHCAWHIHQQFSPQEPLLVQHLPTSRLYDPSYFSGIIFPHENCPNFFCPAPFQSPPCIQGEIEHLLTGQPCCLGQTSLSKTVSPPPSSENQSRDATGRTAGRLMNWSKKYRKQVSWGKDKASSMI